MLQHSCSLSLVFDLYPPFKIRGQTPHPPSMYLMPPPPRMSQFLSRCCTSSHLLFALCLFGIHNPCIWTVRSLWYVICFLMFTNAFYKVKKTIHVGTKNVFLLQSLEYYRKLLNFQKVCSTQRGFSSHVVAAAALTTTICLVPLKKICMCVCVYGGGSWAYCLERNSCIWAPNDTSPMKKDVGINCQKSTKWKAQVSWMCSSTCK